MAGTGERDCRGEEGEDLAHARRCSAYFPYTIALSHTHNTSREAPLMGLASALKERV